MKMSPGELRGVYLHVRVRQNGSHDYAMDEAVYTAVKIAEETQDPTACDRWRRVVDEAIAGVPRPIREGRA